MTEVAEENQAPQTEATDEAGTDATATDTDSATAPADSAPATPKAPKAWSERIKTSLENGKTNGRYAYFKEFIERESDGEQSIDVDTMALVMTLVNPWRQTQEYKDWDVEYRATTGGGSTPKADVVPKTKEEAQALVKKAEESAARQAKAKATAEARAERARKMLAEMEQEAAGESVDADESDEDVTPDDATEDDAF
jgi:hypothetical protein